MHSKRPMRKIRDHRKLSGIGLPLNYLGSILRGMSSRPAQSWGGCRYVSVLPVALEMRAEWKCYCCITYSVVALRFQVQHLHLCSSTLPSSFYPCPRSDVQFVIRQSAWFPFKRPTVSHAAPTVPVSPVSGCLINEL